MDFGAELAASGAIHLAVGWTRERITWFWASSFTLKAVGVKLGVVETQRRIEEGGEVDEVLAGALVQVALFVAQEERDLMGGHSCLLGGHALGVDDARVGRRGNLLGHRDVAVGRQKASKFSVIVLDDNYVGGRRREQKR